ncbi:MAG: class I SAM-dependent RNA methyltransferase [Bernardetiaceae bacterium]
MFIATTLSGLEPLLAKELEDLGATQVTQQLRAVSFEGDLRLLYQANYCLRTAIRILMPLHQFSATNEMELYDGVREVDWTAWLSSTGTLAVSSTVNSEVFTHSQYAALKTKDAIVDQFREKYRFRPSVDVENPDMQVHIHINGSTCSVSLDSSGDSLHRRGYRLEGNEAPLNEVLAAGLLKLAGWAGQMHLVDFTCGSGTILVEAAMMARNLPPQRQRSHFGFMGWLNYDRALWRKVKRDVHAQEREFEYLIVGSDIDDSSIEIASQNLVRAKVDEDVRLSIKDFEDRFPPQGKGIVVVNPPYGERLEPENEDELEDIQDFYGRLGKHLKEHYKGYTAWVISSNQTAMNQLGLKSSEQHNLNNGALPCWFNAYPIH